MLPQWMYDQIDEQLAPYRERGISRDWLDGVAEAYSATYASNFVRFIVRSGKLTYRARQDLYPDYIAARFAAVRDATAIIVEDLPDLEFELYLSDGFAGWSKPSAAPAFGFTKHATKDRSVILFPDSISLSKSSELRRQTEEGSRAYPWEAKIAKCFWRGATNDGFANGGFTMDKYQSAVRFRLVQASLGHPDEIDAAFHNDKFSDDAVRSIIRSAGLLRSHVSLEDHMAFKYLALVDGFAPAWSRHFWNFHSNSVVFKQRSDLVIWLDRGVQENVHFVPIANDASDVVDKVREARGADERMQEIAANAQSFVKSDLTDSLISGYMKELLTRYGQIFAA